jgi:hypothetical protein
MVKTRVMVIVTALFAALALGCNPLFPDFNNGFRLDASDPGADGGDGKGPNGEEIVTPGTGPNATYPIVTWPVNLAVGVGQTLVNITLPSNAATPGNTPGTFSWVNPNAVAGNAVGTYAHELRFTPTNTANYHTVKKSVNVNVIVQIVPTVTWPTSFSGTAMNYLNSVSLTTANATNNNNASNTQGAFSWTTNSQLVKNTTAATETFTYTLRFTPTDGTYETVTRNNINVVVGKANPSPGGFTRTLNIRTGQNVTMSDIHEFVVAAAQGYGGTPGSYPGYQSSSNGGTTWGAFPSSATGVPTGAIAVTGYMLTYGFSPTDTRNYNSMATSAVITVTLNYVTSGSGDRIYW